MPDTRMTEQEQTTARRIRREVMERVGRERRKRFPVLTTANLPEVLAWEASRLRELVAGKADEERKRLALLRLGG